MSEITNNNDWPETLLYGANSKLLGVDMDTGMPFKTAVSNFADKAYVDQAVGDLEGTVSVQGEVLEFAYGRVQGLSAGYLCNPLSPANGYTNYGSGLLPLSLAVSGNLVLVRGVLVCPSPFTSITLGVVPAGLRPVTYNVINVGVRDGNEACRVDILTNGNINQYGVLQGQWFAFSICYCYKEWEAV